MQVADHYYTTVVEFKRGSTFSAIVTFNKHTGSVVFGEVVIPDEATIEVKDQFLEEAEAYLLKEVENAELASGYFDKTSHGWGGEY